MLPQVHATDFSFDGGSREIGGFSPQAGQGVEKSGLAGIGIPYQRQRERAMLARSSRVEIGDFRVGAHAQASSRKPQ
jgi:hypothetical protein